MKRIGIDARLYFETGVGVYIRNLLYYLQQCNTQDFTFYVYILKKDASKVRFTTNNFLKREVTAHWHSFREQVHFLNDLLKDDLDLMHFTYFSHPIFYKKPFIATIHDTILLQQKTGKASTKNKVVYELKHRAFKYALSNQVKKSQLIITPTEAVKDQLLELYGKQIEEKIVRIYEGVNHELLEATENTELQKDVKNDFFIYIGNFYPHKNLERLIEAYSQIQTKKKLFLIGPRNYFSNRVSQYINKLQCSDRVQIVNDASNEDLKYYYSHAQALIHPSLSEGFGLPLLEAVYFNCPVVASNIAVFKELLGKTYTSFNPYSVGDIKAKIENFMQTKQHVEYGNLIERYSFERMAKKILEIYTGSPV